MLYTFCHNDHCMYIIVQYSHLYIVFIVPSLFYHCINMNVLFFFQYSLQKYADLYIQEPPDLHMVQYINNVIQYVTYCVCIDIYCV